MSGERVRPRAGDRFSAKLLDGHPLVVPETSLVVDYDADTVSGRCTSSERVVATAIVGGDLGYQVAGTTGLAAATESRTRSSILSERACVRRVLLPRG